MKELGKHEANLRHARFPFVVAWGPGLLERKRKMSFVRALFSICVRSTLLNQYRKLNLDLNLEH